MDCEQGQSDTEFWSAKDDFEQDPIAINNPSGADSSHGSHLQGDEDEITPALPSPNRFGEGEASSTGPSSLEKENATNGGGIQVEGSTRHFSLDELLIATNNFADALVIGTGGFGKVYKGLINDGATTAVVAMKRWNAESKQGAKEFWTEVNLLSKFRHTHLVSLIGYCDEGQEMILVYEYIACGTLASHLYKTSREESGESVSHLTWEQRLNICLGAARGLDYLHNGTEQGIIHRDVKSTNILLDENWVAKVSDFGLSKRIPSHTTSHVSTNVKGTFGYYDPDYFFTHQLTKKSDVYAFGVVLLEVLCRRRPVDTRLEEEQISLILWAKMYIKRGKLDQIIDSSLNGETTPRNLMYFAKLANKCLHTQPKQRPTMSEVVESLEIALAAQDRQGKKTGKLAMEQDRQGKKTGKLAMEHCFPFRWKALRTCKMAISWNLIDIPQKFPHFSLAEIHTATNNFNDGLLINQDSSTCFEFYKGHMMGGTLVVAMKRYKLHKGINKARAEIQVQSLSGHPNIVALIGVCAEINHEMILLYEYMINGTLHSHLHGTGKDPLLWKKRLEICIDIGGGLEYLHTNVELQLIHRNIKPSHIFLDEKWVAKVANFELSSHETDFQAMRATSLYQAGYFDDNEIYGKDTKTSDVYGFGVVLLEVLCAKEPYTRLPYIGEDPLLLWLKGSIKRGTLEEIIDPYLIGKIAPDCLGYYVNIALSCLIKEAIRRPSMGDVLGSLQSTLQLQEAWEKSIEKGDELPMADVPSSYNSVISVNSEFTIGEQSFLVSDLIRPWEIISPSLPFSEASTDSFSDSD